MQQAHDDALRAITTSKAYTALLEDLKGRDTYTGEDRDRIEWQSSEALAAYYEALPDLIAWIVVGIAKHPITGEAHNRALEAVLSAKAGGIQSFLSGLQSGNCPENVLPLGLTGINLAKAVEQLKRVETHLFVNPANLNAKALLEF